MIKIRIQGTKNDMKSFIKWLRRATNMLPKYEIKNESEFYKNSDTDKYSRWYANIYKNE
ncbi:MAG: hypothetical protein MJ191_06000 [Clostridium sp.]|nr:hypothetical protein [Clostridium sp.]